MGSREEEDAYMLARVGNMRGGLRRGAYDSISGNHWQVREGQVMAWVRTES
jgi:hypothetical protein